MRFQSTHPLRGATVYDANRAMWHRISIHAPLAGCDNTTLNRCMTSTPFQSTHPLRGATWPTSRRKQSKEKFQSTHPLRGATRDRGLMAAQLRDFNPRTPCGVRRWVNAVLARRVDFNPRTPCGVRLRDTSPIADQRDISIHAPLAGCDFYAGFSALLELVISIHAPLAGCDAPTSGLAAGFWHISIHAPLAGCDDQVKPVTRVTDAFQSTHPLRGATVTSGRSCCKARYFNPRTPCGVRR